MNTLLEAPILRLGNEQQTQPDMWLVQTEADGIAFINEHTDKENALCPPYTLACVQTKDCGPFDADIDFDEYWVLMVTRKPTTEERTTQTRIETWVLNHPELKGVLSGWYTVPADQTVRAENNYEDEI